MRKSAMDMKRVRNTLIWTVLILGLIVLLGLAVNRKTEQKAVDVVVDIQPIRTDGTLISEKEVLAIVQEAAGVELKGRLLRKISLRKLESAINRDKRIKKADLYFDARNKLHIRIVQKEPIMRVVGLNGEQYYLDVFGRQVPVTVGCAVRVPLVSGINESYSDNVVTGNKKSVLRDAFLAVRYMANDPFLYALVEQVTVSAENDGHLVLIPKIGREQILLGDATDMEEKFDKLKIFYRDGLPRLGWQRYRMLNLTISGQVVGSLTPVAMAEREAARQDSLQASLIVDETTSDNKPIHH